MMPLLRYVDAATLRRLRCRYAAAFAADAMPAAYFADAALCCLRAAVVLIFCYAFR